MSKFQLTNAITAPVEAPASAAGAPEAAKEPPAVQTYRLIANPTALSPLVGKKLELTGTLDEQAGGTGTAASPALKVESGKIVAESCSPQ